MKTYAPDYYRDFKCIASACKNTCCQKWEIDVDDDTLKRYLADEYIAPHIITDGTPRIKLKEDGFCPFLTKDRLCGLILKYGEDSLCRICADHPRFRSFWTDRTEIGIGLVCEEAARIILTRSTPMKLTLLSDDGIREEVSDEEKWLLDLRDDLLSGIRETGPKARLMEYLIYRHLADALYDNRVKARVAFIAQSYKELTELWDKTDGSIDAIIEASRLWSYDAEYDDEELEKRISALDK